MSQPRDYSGEITDAVIAGDLRALAKLCIELNTMLIASQVRQSAPEIAPVGASGAVGYVYYVAAGDRVKIGHSRNPWARLKTLQTAHPSASLLVVEPGDRELERRRHAQFASSRVEGEWFDWTPELTALVAELRPTTGSRRVATSSEGGSEGSSTVETTPPPSPSLLSPTPPYNSSSPTPPRSASRAGAGHEIEDDALRPLIDEADWPSVERFLGTRRADKRAEWRREMAKLIGGGSQYTSADLAGACSDALIVDEPLQGPHALRAFLAKRRDERLNPPTERKAGQRRGEAEGESWTQRRAAEAREKEDEQRRVARGRAYDRARAAAVDEWAQANADEYAKITANLQSVVTFGPESVAFAAVVRAKVADVIGFPTEDEWTGTWTPRPIAPLSDPYATPANDDAAREAAEGREIAEGYHEQLDAHVENWRKSHQREYREHADAVYGQFGYTSAQKLTAGQRDAVNRAINLRIRDEQGWSTLPVWVEKEQRKRRSTAMAVAS